jgi:hypothetical protein
VAQHRDPKSLWQAVQHADMFGSRVTGRLLVDHFWYALALGGVLAVGNVFYSLVL